MPKVISGAEKVCLDIATNAWLGIQKFSGLEQAEGVVHQWFVACKKNWVDIAHTPKEVIVDVEVLNAALGIKGGEVENRLLGSRGSLVSVR